MREKTDSIIKLNQKLFNYYLIWIVHTLLDMQYRQQKNAEEEHCQDNLWGKYFWEIQISIIMMEEKVEL